MQAALKDKVFGSLDWDEDAETYHGTVPFPPEKAVSFGLVIHNAEDCSKSEFTAFLAAARKHFQELSKDDARYRQRAADVVGKVLDKEGKKPPAGLAAQLRIHNVQIDNGGITMLYYDTAGLLPEKQRFVAIGLDMSGAIHIAKAVKRVE